MTELYKVIARTQQAKVNCLASGNDEWHKKHCETLDYIERNFLPRGAGFDNGCTLHYVGKSGSKIVIATSFHHMDNNGSYDGWTEHTITVTPDLASGFNLRISGRDKHDIKDFIAQVFQNTLDGDVNEIDIALGAGHITQAEYAKLRAVY